MHILHHTGVMSACGSVPVLKKSALALVGNKDHNKMFSKQ